MATLSNNDIAKTIYLVTKDKTDAELPFVVNDIVKFLSKKRLMSKTKDIILKLQNIINKENNTVSVKISSAKKLDDRVKRELIESLKHRYSAKEIILIESFNESLLGGIRIEAKDELIDLTAKNKIKELQEYLTRNV